MDNNIFGITEEDLAQELDIPYHVTEDGISLSKDVMDAAERMAELSEEVLRGILIEGKEEEVELTSKLPIFPPIVKATAILLGPYEFLLTYCLDHLPDQDGGTSLTDALKLAMLLTNLYDKDSENVNTRMLLRLFTGMYTYGDGAEDSSFANIDPELLKVTTQYTVIKTLTAPGVDRLFEIGAAMLDIGIFERLGIEFTEDNTLIDRAFAEKEEEA